MNRRSIAAWTAAYTAITIALTFPLILHLSTTVPHDLGDPLLSTSILWWNAHVMPLTARWWDGFAFYPAHGFLAYSDHRLGESLIATPLQWLGAAPVTAYNLTLLATFPLCAIAAHWLAFTLTTRHDAAALGGLAYGFNPYRIAHLPHLELLAAFGMPAALAALHRYIETRHRKWLAIFALALALQGLCTSYYALFFGVLLALWAVWFLRWRDLRALLSIGTAAAIAAIALLPIMIGYARVHRHYGLARAYGEIVALSADITGLVTPPPLSMLWGWMARPGVSENELFPGLTIAALAVIGGALALRKAALAGDRLDRTAVWLLIPAAFFAVVAVCAWTLGPWRLELVGVTASSEAPFKPMSLAAFFLAAAVALSSPVRAAYARRSTFAFYLIATGVMFLLAMGPKPSVLHHQVLCEPPYTWLMRLPVFGAIRVPARFAMLMMLTLATSGALAFSRLRLEGARRLAVAVALMLAVAADGAIRNLPLPTAPEFWPADRAAGFAAVLELPLGDVFDDIAAIYRTTNHRRPVINGNSGFEAAHYRTLVTALREHDPTALDAVAADPVLIVIHKPMDRDGSWQRYLMTIPGVTRLDDGQDHFFFARVGGPPAPHQCSGDKLPIAGVFDNHGPVEIRPLVDGDASTLWRTPTPQRVGDSLVMDLGRVEHPCAVNLSAGETRTNYARRLNVDLSVDGLRWMRVASVRTAGLTIHGRIDDPKMASFATAFEPTQARFVRMSADESSETEGWALAELSVVGVRRPE